MDIKPNFSQFERQSEQEKQIAYEQFVVAQKKRETISKITKPIWIGLLVLIGLAIIARILILISGIPHTIDKEFSAVQLRMNDETIVDNTTITIKGKLYKKWFSDYRFEGTFIVNNYEFTKTEKLAPIIFYKQGLDSMGYLLYSSYNNGLPDINMFAAIKMTDDFDKVLIMIFEPIESDSSSIEDLRIFAPASSQEEALVIWNELE